MYTYQPYKHTRIFTDVPYKASKYVYHTNSNQNVLLTLCFYRNKEKLTTKLIDCSDSPYGMLNMC